MSNGSIWETSFESISVQAGRPTSPNKALTLFIDELLVGSGLEG